MTQGSRNQANTRADLIDPKLVEAVENSYIRRIFGGGERASALSTDYVPEYQDSKLTEIEVKIVSLSYAEGVHQAKNYVKRLQRPFGYTTNGHDIYQIDRQTSQLVQSCKKVLLNVCF